ncbi:hypothetical protein FACS1894188_10290 [Clostridia bacterium]|nr:hypothetical protein FACS1894188_10290 [Clostridia bacterium]
MIYDIMPYPLKKELTEEQLKVRKSKQEDKMTKIPNIVYHYCSIETFFNIISNKTFRLSNT